MTTAPHRQHGAARLDAAMGRLRRVAPRPAGRARCALDVALAGTVASPWPEVAWRASRLTNTGFPVELAWSSRDAAIRWTAEAAGPEVAERDRLDAALAVLGRLGVEAKLPAWLRSRQAREPRFGAWLGGRHDGERDSYKLYVDVTGFTLPSGWLEPSLLDAIPPRVAWRMVGVGSDVELVEVYGRLRRPAVWEIERLLIRCGLDPAPLIDLVVELKGPRRDDALLPGTGGLSLATQAGRSLAVGAFVHAGPWLGGEPAVTRAVRRAAERHGWDTTIYEAALGPDEPSGPGRQGILGFGVAADNEPWMQIGVRP
jgi:hypothetical protein